MKKVSTNKAAQGQASLIRLGGLAIIVGLAIHVILNVVLKKFPPEDPTSAELQAYLSNEAGTWAIVHGFRYVAFACIVLFAAGLFTRRGCVCVRSACVHFRFTHCFIKVVCQ